MPVKIDPAIVEELASMDLVIWSAVHPKFPTGCSEKTGKPTMREDKSWVIVTLTGPGVERESSASGPTLRRAVDNALAVYFPDRVSGLKGAMLRLGEAMFGLRGDIHERLYDLDTVPF